MNRWPRTAWLIAAIVFVAGGAHAREARIKLPAGLAERTERLDLKGIGGARSGWLQLGSSAGEFTRRSDRIGIVDPLFARNTGGSTVRISGPDVGGTLSVHCHFSRSTTTVGPLSFTTQRLTSECRFEREGSPIAAQFELHERDGALGSADGLEAREGTIVFEGVKLAIRSLHMPDGSILPVPHALGYRFDAAGEPVGAIDLNGNTKRLFLPVAHDMRAAVIAASLAIALFWDPALVNPTSDVP